MLSAVPSSRRSSASEKVRPHDVVSSSVAMPSITVHALPRGIRNDSPLPPAGFPWSRRRRSWSEGEGQVAARRPPPLSGSVAPPSACGNAPALFVLVLVRDAVAGAVPADVLNRSSGMTLIEMAAGGQGNEVLHVGRAAAIGCASSTKQEEEAEAVGWGEAKGVEAVGWEEEAAAQ